MRKILILTGRYLPGFKDGGPVKSIKNLVDVFGDAYEINIVCLDRDHGDDKPYDGVNVGAYNRVGKANVYYASQKEYTLGLIKGLAADVDIVYSCGPYNSYAIYAMILKLFGQMKCPLFVAPMGSFSPNAYAIKGRKKQLFVKVMKTLKLFDKVVWSVTSQREEEELKAVLGNGVKTVIAADLPAQRELVHTRVKDNSLKVIFLSRISRKKNLLAAARIMQKVSKDYSFEFHIYGNMEDEEYYNECLTVLNALPDHVSWKYMGAVLTDDTDRIWPEYDVFLFPTLGENYGHVIEEAMSAGVIPVISDQTPWMDIYANHAGYTFALHDEESFVKTLNDLAAQSGEGMRELSENTQRYIRQHNADSIANSGYKKVFEYRDGLSNGGF